MNARILSACAALLIGVPLPIAGQGEYHSAAMQVIHGKPYVDVLINGKGPFRFMIDTGTGAEAVIQPGAADELHLPQSGTMFLGDPSGQGGRTVPVRVMDTVTVAGVDFYAIRAAEHTLLDTEVPCDGLLGFKLFQGFLLTLDYPASRVILEDGELVPDGDVHVHSFRMPENVPLITLSIGDLKFDALVDSGGAGLSIPQRYARQLKFSADPEMMGTARSLATHFFFEAAKLAGDVRLGDITFVQPWVEMNAVFPIANFGSVPLQHFVVTFDQDNLLMRIDGPRKRINLGEAPAPLENPPIKILVPGPGTVE